MYVERHDAVPSSSPSLSSLPPSQSGDPFAADEIVELLTDLIHNADSEDDSTALLVEIEDVIVNDVVRSASSTLPSTAPLPSVSSRRHRLAPIPLALTVPVPAAWRASAGICRCVYF